VSEKDGNNKSDKLDSIESRGVSRAIFSMDNKLLSVHLNLLFISETSSLFGSFPPDFCFAGCIYSPFHWTKEIGAYRLPLS